MNDQRLKIVRLGAVALMGASLSGCVAQALNAAFEASMTPETVGVTTSTWRGKSCATLEFSEANMAGQKQEAVAKGDTQLVKITGWQMDAIRQVRTEQGCIAGTAGATVPASGQVTAYGYCTTSTEEHVYVTPVFTYGDFYSDGAAAESAAFTTMLRSTYGYTGSGGGCVMEDSPAKAQAAMERTANITTMIIGWSTVHVPWTPPPMVKAPKAAVATTPASVPGKTSTATATASNNVEAQGLGLTLETPNPELVKALGLKDSSGAWVVDVTPGSAAAKAGIKAMDVIQDVSGQQVNVPGDVQAITGKLRAGYKATLGVWRDRGSHEVSLVIPAGAVAPATVAKLQPVAPAPSVPTVASTVAPAQATVPDGKPFCHAYIYVVKKPGGWQSSIFQTTSDNQTSSVMIASLAKFVAQVRQEQPEQWRPFTFAPEQCSPQVGYCYANGEKSLLKADQMAGQFCFATRAEAETHVASFNSVKPVYEQVDFKP
ncbi:PDZ domain-containing protein [Pseudomonas sp. NPDC086278]|uniref:PDZ domain-containing protein n=1 Tax=Pseudomonas sp. NPDC086278 TaxID=3390646 RepID=UPI003D033C1D